MTTHPRFSRRRLDLRPARSIWMGLCVLALAMAGVAFAQGTPSGKYGEIAIGGSVEGTIAAATQQEFTYHTYFVQVPAGTGPVTIRVDGMGADLDLAVRVGAPISDYDDVDHLDTSEDPNPTYTVANAAGAVIYLDVLNLVQQAAGYTVTVSAGDQVQPTPQPAPAPQPGPDAGGYPSPIGPNGEAMPSGEYGPIAIGASVAGAIEAAGEYGAFHTYWIEVPQPGTDLTIAIDGMGSDLDVALKVGAPIANYDDVDYVDTSDDPNPIVVIEGVDAGRIYVDVLNLLRQPARYRMTVTAGLDSRPGPTPTPAPDGDANPLAGDPLVGSFEGDGLRIVVQGGRGSYTGELVLNGQRFPFQATGGNGRLEGAFSSGGQAFAFAATLTGDTLTVESGGGRYMTQRTSEGPVGPVNPLDPGGDAPAPVSPADDPVLAEAAYGTLTLDNLLAFFEALFFAHEQVGVPLQWTDEELRQFASLAAQAYPELTPDEQLALSMSREIWNRVQANWAQAAAADQQEFVIGVLAMWYGDQQVAQWMGGGGGSQTGACTDIDACFSQYASPETYDDAMNAQSCWAAAGCSGYDPSYNEFTYEDYSYDSY